MLYILNISHDPNTAATNKLLGYYAALDKLGINSTIVFLLPNSLRSKVTHHYGIIRVIYFWRRNLYNHKIFRWFLFRLNLFRFLITLKKGDVIYTYGVNYATKATLRKHGVRVFAERTEHPFAVPRGGKITEISQDEQMEVTRKLDGLFVISEPLRDYFISQGIASDKVHIINMIVDPTRFSELKANPAKERYIAYCGTASNNKDGVDELIKAFAVVASNISDVKLYIIGKTPSRNDEASNLQLIESLGLSNRVIFTGVVPAKDMPQLLKNAEVLALDRPDSLQAQCGFPTKLGEYLLTERPVVVTKVGDIPKFLKDGETALLAEQRNTESFSSKLVWALTHPKEASLIGQRGARVALKDFNNQTETQKLINIMYNK